MSISVMLHPNLACFFQFSQFFFPSSLFRCTELHISQYKLFKLQVLDFTDIGEPLKLLNVMESHQRSINNVVYRDPEVSPIHLEHSFTPFPGSPDFTLPHLTMKRKFRSRSRDKYLATVGKKAHTSPKPTHTLHFPTTRGLTCISGSTVGYNPGDREHVGEVGSARLATYSRVSQYGLASGFPRWT